MVLILGRRLNREDSAPRDSPAVKRKVFEVDPKSLNNQDIFDFNCGSSHSEAILQVFNEFRDCRLFTDVVISVQGREFPCHRAVLSACSSYFRSMFCNDHRESREMLVEINGILAEAMDSFLSFVYSGRAKITTENVQFLFETSSLFQIVTLRDACAKFLEEQLDPCNCLGIQRFADAHALKQLASRCRVYALANFAELRSQRDPGLRLWALHHQLFIRLNLYRLLILSLRTEIRHGRPGLHVLHHLLFIQQFVRAGLREVLIGTAPKELLGGRGQHQGEDVIRPWRVELKPNSHHRMEI
ncbi:hypothetical protein CRUP_025418 [Coryphaenoides rupestris]|nr:hypothetical protein CRUP_025418 [Coryphaenoides rupestris]